MHGPSFVQDLAIVLGVAGVTGLFSQWLKQPSVLGYLFAGLVVGPYLSVPLFADFKRVESLSEFGVVLVMFAVGLEFRIERFLRVLPTAGLTTLIEISVLFTVGYALGNLFGWNELQSLFLGACICISSTMAVTKILVRHPVNPATRELIFGVLVLQDVAAVGLIAVMTALAKGAEASFHEVLIILAKLVAILIVLLMVGMLVIPRYVRSLVATKSAETLVVGAVGVCFSTALLAKQLGYSTALGAFIGGVLVAESGHGHKIERVSSGVRDVFAAVFFVSVGMTVNPSLALESLPLALVVLAAVTFAQLIGVVIGGTVSGSGLSRSVAAGLSLGQIGEFAFILAGIGADAGALPAQLKPILVVVATLSIFTSSQLLNWVNPVTKLIERMLPGRMLRLLSIYETWLDKLRTRPDEQAVHPAQGRRFLPLLLLDLGFMLAIVLAWQSWEKELGSFLARVLRLRAQDERILSTFALVIALIVPLIPLTLGARQIATRLADKVFGSERHHGHALLRAVLMLLAMTCVGLPLSLLLGPILGVRFVWPALLTALVVPGYFAWKSANRWDHAMTSSGLLVLKTISEQSLPEQPEEHPARLSGLAHVRRVPLIATSFAVGKTLTELQLRSLTGASVIGISNAEASFLAPSADRPLVLGDTLLVAGSTEDQDTAERLLQNGGEAQGQLA